MKHYVNTPHCRAQRFGTRWNTKLQSVPMCVRLSSPNILSTVMVAALTTKPIEIVGCCMRLSCLEVLIKWQRQNFAFVWCNFRCGPNNLHKVSLVFHNDFIRSSSSPSPSPLSAVHKIFCSLRSVVYDCNFTFTILQV